jgi:hypothetical protein
MIDLDSTLVIAEIFAALALLANIVAYRQQNINSYRIFSGIAMLLLAIHFFQLEAYSASVGCSLAVIRNIVSLKFNDWITTSIFVAVNLISLCVEWFYLKHDLTIFIAYTASIIFTIGTLRLRQVIDIRRWFTLAEGLNLTYAILVGSLFGSIYSVVNLIVLLVFWIKYYKNKKIIHNI